jgi:hypothetical protein
MVPAHGDLSDPDYEPSDEELAELVHSAFRDVNARNLEALRRIHLEIAQLRAARVARPDALERSEPGE